MCVSVNVCMYGCMYSEYMFCRIYMYVYMYTCIQGKPHLRGKYDGMLEEAGMYICTCVCIVYAGTFTA